MVVVNPLGFHHKVIFNVDSLIKRSRKRLKMTTFPNLYQCEKSTKPALAAFVMKQFSLFGIKWKEVVNKMSEVFQLYQLIWCFSMEHIIYTFVLQYY